MSQIVKFVSMPSHLNEQDKLYTITTNICPVLTNTDLKILKSSKYSILIVYINIKYLLYVHYPFKIKPFWPWLNLGLFLVSTGMRWDGTLCPWLHLSIAGLLFKSFLKASCFTELCRWKGSSNTLPPKPNAHSLPFMPHCLALYCIVKPRGNYNTWLYFFFFLWSRTSQTIHSSKHGCMHTHSPLFLAAQHFSKPRACGVENCTKKMDFMDVS